MSSNNTSTTSVMFEEIKQMVKRLEEKLNIQNSESTKSTGISTPDLVDLENRLNQSGELMLSKLEQIEHSITQPVRQKLHHKVSIDIKSSWVFLTMIGLFLFLVMSLVLNYNQKQENNRLADNDFKYRFIKASNQVDSIKLSELENIFTYNRSEKAIKELQERVISYEKALAEQARKLEQANFKEQEAERLKQEAEELKGSK